MIVAFQIVLVIAMVIGLIGMIGEKKDINLRNNLTAVFISATIAFIISVLFL